MLTHVEMVTRIAVGALLGACIGFERTRRGNPLGLRTHLLVALGAALFMVLSSQFVFYQHYDTNLGGKLIQVDTSRIASLVVSGIGFLAGGAIFRAGDHVQNLTSAAGLWLVTATGMAAGAGLYLEAASATGLGLFALVVVRHLEDKAAFPIRGSLELAAREHLPEICRKVERAGMVVYAVEEARDRVTLRFELKQKVERGVVAVAEELRSEPGVQSVIVERAG